MRACIDRFAIKFESQCRLNSIERIGLQSKNIIQTAWQWRIKPLSMLVHFGRESCHQDSATTAHIFPNSLCTCDVHYIISRHDNQLIRRKAVVPDVDDRGVEVCSKQRLEGALYLLSVGGLEVLKRRIGGAIRVRINEGIKGIGNGNLRMRISREAKLRK